MENLLHRIPYFSTPEDALVSIYRVHVVPLPCHESAGRVQRFEGFFYSVSAKRDPELLLAGLTPDCEIILMVVDEIGEVGKVLRHGRTRERFDEGGCLWRLGNIVYHGKINGAPTSHCG